MAVSENPQNTRWDEPKNKSVVGGKKTKGKQQKNHIKTSEIRTAVPGKQAWHMPWMEHRLAPTALQRPMQRKISNQWSDTVPTYKTNQLFRTNRNGTRGRSAVVVQALSRVRLFSTSWTIAHQAPLSLEFPRQEYLSGLPFPSPGARRVTLRKLERPIPKPGEGRESIWWLG